MVAKAPATLQGRRVGALVGDGFDAKLLDALRVAVEKEGARLEVVAPKIGGAATADGAVVPADHMISGGPSVIFDAVAVLPGAAAVPALVTEASAIDWVSDAFTHCKVIGTVAAAQPLLDKARVVPDDGVVDLAGKAGIAGFIATAKRGRIWAREPEVRGPDRRPIAAPGRSVKGAAKAPPPPPPPKKKPAGRGAGSARSSRNAKR